MPKRKIPKLAVFDFDGVLTDNRVIVMQDGREAVLCNRSDGLGTTILRRAGHKVLILTTEKNPVVVMRARKLKVPVIRNAHDKVKSLTTYCVKLGIALRDVLYVGNDLNDVELLKRVGFPYCPRDSHPRVKRLAKVLTCKGGEGVAREIAEKVYGLTEWISK